MKASIMLVTITLALTAYGCDSSPADRAASGKMEAVASGPVTVTASSASRALAGRAVAQFNDVVVPAAPTDAVSPESPTYRPDPLQGVNAGSASPTMVIRTGQAFVEVEKVDDAVLKIRRLATQVGGYITNSSISGGRGQNQPGALEVQ